MEFMVRPSDASIKRAITSKIPIKCLASYDYSISIYEQIITVDNDGMLIQVKY
jgi:hypothetical protein